MKTPARVPSGGRLDLERGLVAVARRALARPRVGLAAPVLSGDQGATTALGHPVGAPRRHTVASWHRGRATMQLGHGATMHQSHSVAVPHCGTITM
jgi:hypothetical protein